MRSLLDNVAPLMGRRIGLTGTSNCPLFIAFLTALVNDVPDSFCLTLVSDETLELIEGTVWDFDVGIETRSANGVHRRFVTVDDAVDVDRAGAKKGKIEIQ